MLGKWWIKCFQRLSKKYTICRSGYGESNSTAEFIYLDGWKVYDDEFGLSKTDIECTDELLTFNQDFDGDGTPDTTWVLSRRAPEVPFEGRWYAPFVGTPEGPDSVVFVDGYFVFGPGDYYELMMYEPDESAETDGDLQVVSTIGSYTYTNEALDLTVDAIFWDDIWATEPPDPSVAGWTIPYVPEGDSIRLYLDFNLLPPESAIQWLMDRQ